MRFPLLLLPAAALLLGCSPPDPYEQQLEEARQAAAARSIEGRYVVTYIDQEEAESPIEGYDLLVDIKDGRLHFGSQCIYADWSYERDGEQFETGPWDYGEPRAMCERMLSADEEAAIAALDAADTVRFVPRGLWFSGSKGTVQMRFVPSEADLAGRDIELTGSWVAQALDGRDLAPGIPLEASWDAIWWEPGCAGQGVSYSIEGSRFAAPEPGNPGLVCDIGFEPELTEIWSAMVAADSVESTANGGVLISGNGRSVLLEKYEGEVS